MKYCQNLDAQPKGGLCTKLGTSSQDVARSASSSLPEPPGAQAKASPGGAVGSLEEPNTKTQ